MSSQKPEPSPAPQVEALRDQIAVLILKKFLGVTDFKQSTEGWDTGCKELADEILALTHRPEPAGWRWRARTAVGDVTHWIYGPSPEWREAHVNDPRVEFQPLYTAPPSDAVREDLQRVYDWMRAPDFAEDFDLESLTNWVNDRPIGEMLRALSSKGTT